MPILPSLRLRWYGIVGITTDAGLLQKLKTEKLKYLYVWKTITLNLSFPRLFRICFLFLQM